MKERLIAAKEEEKRRLLKRSAELLQEKTDLQNRTQRINELLAVCLLLFTHLIISQLSLEKKISKPERLDLLLEKKLHCNLDFLMKVIFYEVGYLQV